MKWLIVALALAGGCKSEDTRVGPGGPSGPGDGQSMKEAMTLLCHANEKAKSPKPIDVAIYIEENVRHPAVVKLLHSLGAADKTSADQQVREMAKRAGVEPCPFAGPTP